MHFVYFSDLHDREYTWKKLNVRGDSAFAMQQIVDYAIEWNVDAVVSGGDLFHAAINKSSVPVRITRQIRELTLKGIPFLFINGNHDATDPPWVSTCEEAVHLHDDVCEIEGVRIGGIDSCGRDAFYEYLRAAEDRKPDVLVVHQLWENWTNFGGPTMCGDVRELANCCDLLLTGDMHKFAKLSVQKHGKQFMAVSAGAATRQKIDEPEDNWFLHIHVDQGSAQIRQRQLVSRPYVLFDVNGADELDWCVNELKELAAQSARLVDDGVPAEVAVPLVKVKYSSAVDVQTTFRKCFDPGAFHFMYERKVQTATTGLSYARSERTDAIVTVVDAIDEQLQDDTDLGALAKQLWECDDVSGLLDAYVDREITACS